MLHRIHYAEYASLVHYRFSSDINNNKTQSCQFFVNLELPVEYSNRLFKYLFDLLIDGMLATLPQVIHVVPLIRKDIMDQVACLWRINPHKLNAF